MKKRNRIVAATLATGLLVAAVAGAVNAHGRGGFAPGAPVPGVGGPPGMAMDRPGFRHPGLLLGLMRAVAPSSEQRNEIFDILHTQALISRDQMKKLRKGHDALHEAAITNSYDGAKVRELADMEAKRISDLIVTRTETFNKIHGLLTPEQQKKLAELVAEFKESS